MIKNLLSRIWNVFRRQKPFNWEEFNASSPSEQQFREWAAWDERKEQLRSELKQWYFNLFFEQSVSLAEFGDWIQNTGELETAVFDESDYGLLYEINFTDPFSVHEVRRLVKKCLPQIEMECETFLLQRKLERALQMPFLSMVEEVDDLRSLQHYSFLTEWGITSYTDADVYNFRTAHPKAVDEKAYEDAFPHFREQINQVISWLRTGELQVVVEKELAEKIYRCIDRRKPVDE